MAGTAAILTALGRVVVRDLRTLGSLAGNNFFLFCFFLLTGAGPFVHIILALILLAPLGGDPLGKAPKERVESWPVTARQRVLLRAGSLALNPALWITVALLLGTARPWLGLQFAVLVMVIQSAGLGIGALRRRAPQWSMFRWAPRLPGVTGKLVRKNLREQMSVLDPYPALVLSAGSLLYQGLAPSPEPEAKFGLTLLVVIAMSTSAQCLFGLDGDAGLTRYRMWPVRGWQVLAAKGAAFVGVTVALCAPLAPLAGASAALAALAVGHYTSVLRPRAQQRWRFTGGSLLVGVVQVIAMLSAATMTYRVSALMVMPCAALWAGSVWWFGRSLDR